MINNNDNFIFEFHVACPKYKEKIISLNKSDVSKWLKWKETEIKNTYKDTLKDWHIPTPQEEQKLDRAFIAFHLYRHNKRKFDADNLGYIIK